MSTRPSPQPVKRRRPKGDGSIYPNPNGRGYLGMVWIADPSGESRRRKVSGPSKQAVAAKITALKQTAAEGLDPGKGPRIAAVAETWLTMKAAPRKARSTLERVRGVVEDVIIPDMGPTYVRQLTVAQVDDWMAKHARAGKARRTIDGYRAVLREILDFAIARNMTRPYNAARLAELPLDAKPPRTKQVLDAEQSRRLLEVLTTDRYGPYFSVILLLGLRPGEADALTWSAIDAEAGTIVIHSALQRGDNGAPLGIDTTKTGQTRVLHLSDPVRRALADQRARQEQDRALAGKAWSSEWPDLVFTSEVGTPGWPSNLRRALAKCCARAGLPRLTPYELRHSAASLLCDTDLKPYEVQDLLGHVDGRMLDRYYRHRMHPVASAGAERLGQLLG